MTFAPSSSKPHYVASLRLGSLFVVAVNTIVPLLFQLSPMTRGYAMVLIELHTGPLFVQQFELPMNLKFFIYLALSLAFVISLVAAMDWSLLLWHRFTSPIRMALCAVWYTAALSIVYLIALAIAAV